MMALTSYENLRYNVAVQVFLMTDVVGFLPSLHAQNNDVIYDLPARGGIDTDNDLIDPSSTFWNAIATSLRKGLAEKNS